MRGILNKIVHLKLDAMQIISYHYFQTIDCSANKKKLLETLEMKI